MKTEGDLTQTKSSLWLKKAMGLTCAETPFHWQLELLRQMVNGTIHRSIDIPTGLGKTAVMAIWLVARMLGGNLPRRLVYVVDRRAVVDQATEVAEKLRQCVEQNPEMRHALGLNNRSLPISTLRGQHVDNREWLEDPSIPAIIIGTVDMIGSRLLFEGYGISRKMRPYHAGILGADSLVVLDEAHLVPPFEKLLEDIADNAAQYRPDETTLQGIVPPFRFISLSATGRIKTDNVFSLQSDDLKPDSAVRRRIDASKQLTFLQIKDTLKLEVALAEEAWNMIEGGNASHRVIVYCNERKIAEAVHNHLMKLTKGDKKKGLMDTQVELELFVGSRRVRERNAAANRLRELGFIAGSDHEHRTPAILIATSAGEVGVDLDADHMVSDLVSWERMIQRLGRVNRRGNGRARIRVVISEKPASHQPKFTVQEVPKEELEDQAVGINKKDEREEQAVTGPQETPTDMLKKPFELLPCLEHGYDVSLGALWELKQRAISEPEIECIIKNAISVAPLRPALSRALVDAWSMTSLKEHSGRPRIHPWLRGWQEERPQTSIAWRVHLPVRWGENTVKAEQIEAFFEAAPIQTSEILETETYRVVDWMLSRAKAFRNKATPTERQSDQPAVFALSAAGDLLGLLSVRDLFSEEGENARSKRIKEQLNSLLSEAVCVVDSRLGGLSAEGLLNSTTDEIAKTIDGPGPWFDDNGTGPPASSNPSPPAVRFRIREMEAGQASFPDADWRERLRFPTRIATDGEPVTELVIEKWRYDAATEEDRSASKLQILDEHHDFTARRIRELSERFGLPSPYPEILSMAGIMHDSGKTMVNWQRAANAPRDAIYAKTPGPFNHRLLDGYRHEFGSLIMAESREELAALPDEFRDLVLHLIAAHHGFARPLLSSKGYAGAPPSIMTDKVQETALRFARLQKRWGPWGLAWWEAIFRAADSLASRDIEDSIHDQEDE